LAAFSEAWFKWGRESSTGPVLFFARCSNGGRRVGFDGLDTGNTSYQSRMLGPAFLASAGVAIGRAWERGLGRYLTQHDEFTVMSCEEYTVRATSVQSRPVTVCRLLYVGSTIPAQARETPPCNCNATHCNATQRSKKTNYGEGALLWFPLSALPIPILSEFFFNFSIVSLGHRCPGPPLGASHPHVSIPLHRC